MKIFYKLTLGFLIVSLLIWIMGYFAINKSKESLKKTFIESVESLAIDILDDIDRNLQVKAEIFHEYSHDLILQETILNSNKDFEKLDDIETYISKQDQKWLSTEKEEVTPFMQNIMNNKLSKELSEKKEFYDKKYGYEVFAEVFVTNKYGANVAQTGKTTDYRQNDEEWWQMTKKDGFYAKDVEFDESSNSYSNVFGIRINDENGHFIGVMKVVLNIQEAINMIEKMQLSGMHSGHKNMAYQLMTKEGMLIYSTDEKEKPFNNILHLYEPDYSDESFNSKISYEGSEEVLLIYTHSRGYKDFKGFGWILILKHKTAEIFAPIIELQSDILIASLAVAICGLIIGFIISNSISRNVGTLKNAAVKIGNGDWNTNIDIKSKDEIGELAIVFKQMTENLRNITALRDDLNEEISERKKAQKKLKESEEKYRGIAESSSDLIYILEKNTGKILDVNQTVCEVLGYSKSEIIGTVSGDRVMSEQRDDYNRELEKLKSTGKFDGEFDVRKKDGTIITLDGRGSTFENYVYAVGRDITERKKMEKQLKALSLTDELTGLYNRRGFFNLAEQQLKLAKRAKENVFLLYLDLDRFKEINDTFGHNEGDEALKDIAMILKGIYRDSDVIGRIGGDEFVVFPIGTDDETIEIVVDRLLKNIDIHNRKSNKSYKLSVSVGVANYDPIDPCSLGELITKADKIMYEDKKKKHAANPKLQYSYSIQNNS